MRGVVRQQVGPHDQKADRSGAVRSRGQLPVAGQVVRDPVVQIRMIEPGFRIIDRVRRFRHHTQRRAGTAGISRDQKAGQICNILVRTGEHVLQDHEIGPHILSLARNVAEDAWHRAQQLHLVLAG